MPFVLKIGLKIHNIVCEVYKKNTGLVFCVILTVDIFKAEDWVVYC